MDLDGPPRIPSNAPRKVKVDWNAQLPYFAPSSAHLFGNEDPAKAYENEHKSILSDISAGLTTAAVAGDWYGGRLAAPDADPRVGVLGWIKRLRNYMDLKYPMTPAQRVAFIKFFYSMLSLPTTRDTPPLPSDPIEETTSGPNLPGPDISEYNSRLDPVVLDSICSILTKLFRKADDIKDAVDSGEISPLDLDWKVIWRTWRGLLRVRTRDRVLNSDNKCLINLFSVAEFARHFFADPSGTKRGVLQETLPMIDSDLSLSSGIAWSAAGLLIPSTFPKDDATAFDHLPIFLALYLSAQASPLAPSPLLGLFARTCKENISDPQRLGITAAQLRSIVMVSLGMGGVVDVPAGGRRGVGGIMDGIGGLLGDALNKVKGESGKKLAELLVWNIFPEGEGAPATGVPDLVEDIIAALDTYFHPSNTGKWTGGLVRLVRDLAEGLLERWREEHTPDCKTPENLRLTPQLVARLCAAIRPPILLAMYGKDNNAVYAAHHTIKLLCWLDPDNTFPPVLERIHGSFEEGGTSVHRTSASISLMAQIAAPLFNRSHYPQGAKHLFPLLHAVLPGIDMNDPGKTRASLVFIIGAIMGIPVVEAGTEGGSKPSWRKEGSIVQGPGSGGHKSPAGSEDSWIMADAEDDDDVRSGTASFGEWVAALLDRAFLMLENLPQGFGQNRGSNSAEDQVMGLLPPTVGFVINQASPEIREMAMKKVVNYARSNCIPNATKVMGKMVAAITGYDPSKALATFLPLCRDKIKEELSHGASSRAVVQGTEPPGSDAPLHWWQCIAYNVCQNVPGASLMAHRKVLEELLELTIESCRSDRGYRYAGKLLKRITKSLVDVLPVESRSVPPTKWEDTTYMSKHWEHWGDVTDPNDIGLEWNIPGDAEKDFALGLVEKWAARAFEQLATVQNQLASGTIESRDASNEIAKWLLVIKNVLSGMQSMRVDPDVPGSARRRVIAGYAFADPRDPRYARAKDLREKIGRTLHETVAFMKEKREDDIEAFKVLTKVIGVFICDSSLNANKLDQTVRGYKWYKGMISVPGDHHRFARWVLVLRVSAQQLIRLRFNNRSLPRSQNTATLLEDLVDLSLSRYSKVRQFAQSFLAVSLHVYPSASFELAPKALEVVEQTPSNGAALAEEDSDRFKGALNLLQLNRINSACLADPSLQRRFFLALTKSQFAEKPTLQELVRKSFIDSVSRFDDKSLVSVAGGDIVGKAGAPLVAACGGTGFDQQAVAAVRSQVAQGDSSRKEAYVSLVESLLDVSSSSTTHWRYGSMALTFLELVLCDDLPVSAKLAERIMAGIISEVANVRRTCLSLACRVMVFMKRRSGLLASGTSVTLKVRSRVAVPSPLPANYTSSYVTASLETPSADTLFTDRIPLGWFCWPPTHRVYSAGPETAAGTLPYVDPTSSEALEVFRRTLSDPAFWEKHMAFVSQEASSRNGIAEMAVEVFDVLAAKFYKSAFGMFEDAFLETIAKPVLEKYLERSGNKSKQRAAAELAAGLVRGMKHWSPTKLERTWAWLNPLLLNAVMSSDPESVGYWFQFFMTAFRSRDPRRLLPLVQGILALRLDPSSESFFNEAKKVQLRQALFANFSWRLGNPTRLAILDESIANLRNPYEKVRDSLGVSINDVLQSLWIPSFGSGLEAVAAFANRGDMGTGGIFPEEPNPAALSRIEAVLSDLAKWRVEGEKLRAVNVTATTDYSKAGKTVATWVADSLSGTRLQGTLPYIHKGLLQEMLAMSDFPDQELAKTAQGALAAYGTMPQSPTSLPVGLGILTDALKTSTSWHLRQTVLPVLQVMFFRHLFSLEPSSIVAVMETIAGMLSDPQIEVRQLAAKSLAGLVRCSQRESIDLLKERFTAVLRKTKIPAKLKGPGAAPPTAEYNDSILKRHSAVLGLSSLVASFPYEVPAWMPSVLVVLAGCLDDPAPIQQTVKATFSEFRRTHQDTWHEDKEVFSYEELELLSGALVGATYYV